MEYKSFKLSVVIPIFNAELYLTRCLDSVISQTFKNIEIILVNDGSSDNSLEICERYKKNDNRIRIIDKKNEGVSAARKDGINLSTGNYITFVDADDYLHKDMYSDLVKVIIDEGCDILESGYLLIDEHDVLINKCILQNEMNIGANQCLTSYLSNKNSETFLWNKIYKRELFEDIDLPELRYSEDYLWNVLLYSKCKKSVVTEKTYYYYYKNMSGACNNNNYKAKVDGIIAGIKSKEFLNKNYPSLEYYGTLYVVDYARFLYKVEYEQGVKDKDFYKMLKKYYRDYFPLSLIYNKRPVTKLPGYLLFYLTPLGYMWMNRFYHKMKER